MQPLHDGNIIGKDHPQWQNFYEKWGIAKYWHNGEVIQRFGERPLGIEIVKNNDSADFIRLIIWPKEINNTQINKSLSYIRQLIGDSFNKKENLPWSLGIKDFWCDAKWYELRWRDTH